MIEQPITTAPVSAWNYDWREFRPGSKCLLLTVHGILVVGQTDAQHAGYAAWAPLPQRDKAKEAELARGGRQ